MNSFQRQRLKPARVNESTQLASSPPRKRRGTMLALVWLGLLAIAALLILRYRDHNAAPPVASDAIPVVLGEVAARDVPVTLDALGTVQASANVTIKPMVDGPLLAVPFVEGQDVRAGDVLARIDPRTYQAAYDQAVAKKSQDEATLDNARTDFGRYQKLLKQDSGSGQQADTQRALVAQYEGLVRQDQAQIDTAKTNLSYTTIVSPIDGRTGIRQVDAGNIVHATDTTPLTVVTTLRPIDVVFTLPQQALPDVAAAQAAGAPEVDALPQGGGPGAAATGRGVLTVLDNQVDQTTGTIKLKARFPNDRLTLWPGGFVTVRLLLRTERGVLTVPTEAVQRGPTGAFVYVVDKDMIAHLRAVTVVRQTESLAQISDGVKAGETVAVDGLSRVADGAKVRSVPPAGS